MSTPPGTPTRSPAAEIAAFGLLAVLGAGVLATSFGYGILLDGGRVGPGMLPMVTGALLLLLGAWQLLVRLRRKASDPGPAAAEPATDVLGRTEPYRIRQLRMVAVALPVTVVGVPYLGFLLALGILVLFISTVVERRGIVPALLVTAVALAAVYAVFGLFLDVPLPTGLLGDLVGM